MIFIYLQSAKDALQTFELTVPGVVCTQTGYVHVIGFNCAAM
jgi:hypothetical protein